MRADGLEDLLDGDLLTVEVPGHDRAAVQHRGRKFRRHSAITVPGIVLSQPLIATPRRTPARRDQLDQSAITSRLTSDAFIPAVPIVIPSEIAIVLNSIGVPPAARIPALTFVAESPKVEVARHRLDPGVCDADQGLSERLVVEADALQLGAGGGPFGPFGEGPAAVFEVGVGGGASWGREL